MLQIKYDCKTVISLSESLKSNAISAINITPFLSLFCFESISYFKKYDLKLTLPKNEVFSIEDIRLKTKLFEQKYGKAKKMILNCDYLQDYIFRNKLRFKWMKNMNIHYNLGIYVNQSEEVVGNTQYGYYIFQDARLLKKSIEKVENMVNKNEVNFSPVPKEFFDYGVYCGQIIGEIQNYFLKLGDDTVVKSSNKELPIYFQDFNTNKHFKTVILSKEDKALQLYLLHILSFVNSSIKLLNNFEKTDYGWWLRLYYITFHYAVTSLIDIKTHLQHQHQLTNEIEGFYAELDVEDSRLLNSQFRSCMMHYDLYDKEGNFLILPTYENENVPMFGLVESCFDGLTYSELKTNVLFELEKISEILSEWLGIKIAHKKLL